MAGGGGDERSLELTPTFSVAAICTVFVIVSFIGERTLRYLGQWISTSRRKPLQAAVEKMKEELMLLGFISLLITVAGPSITKICVRTSTYNKVGRYFLPCKDHEANIGTNHLLNGRRLTQRRELLSSSATCSKEGEEPLISFLALEQLHRFLFVLGCTHVYYTCLTLLLAILKVYGWERWEHEALKQGTDKKCMAGVCKNMTSKRQSALVARHTSIPGSRSKLFIWVICFFRQFGQSVTKADYWALRLGFIMKHGLSIQYDFHRYMIRTVEDEFKDVVGISPLFWIFVVLFMLFNIDGSNLYFWMAFLHVVGVSGQCYFAMVQLVMVAGAKLQRIIAQLAIESSGLSGRSQLQPRDSLFWFGAPRLMLHLMHFVFFQDAFELATFCWVWWQFGWESCFMSNKAFVSVRLVSGFLVQVLCSYSTLPLYALVTQMGSEYKKTIFQDNVVESLHKWKLLAAKNKPKAQPEAQVQQLLLQQEETVEAKFSSGEEQGLEDQEETTLVQEAELQEVIQIGDLEEAGEHLQEDERLYEP